jgi:hypothetical protein
VQINLSTSIQANAAATETAAAQGGPVNLITQHSATTEVDINAYDIVELSTFAAQTSGPGSWQTKEHQVPGPYYLIELRTVIISISQAL